VRVGEIISGKDIVQMTAHRDTLSVYRLPIEYILGRLRDMFYLT